MSKKLIIVLIILSLPVCSNQKRANINVDLIEIQNSNISSDTINKPTIYIAGSIYNSEYHNDIACYWKDGQIVLLTNGENRAYASDIAILGNDIYVVGEEYRNRNPSACYWINGQKISLSDTRSSAYSIFISGNDVYISGWESRNVNTWIPCYWKNGQKYI
jgi:hypothetical protein